MSNMIDVAVTGRVAVITLANPPLNVVTVGMMRELSDALDRMQKDDSVRAVILTGHGDRAFCAGSDIKEFPGYVAEQNLLERKLVFENETFTKLDRLPKPTIAAIGALAYGGGLEMASCCDFIVAEDHVRLALPEILLGAFPGSGGTTRVTRRVGEGRAKQLMYLGEPISAETALQWGLVNYVVPRGKALAEARLLAEKLADRPSLGLQRCKQAIRNASEVDDDRSIALVLEYTEEIFGMDDVAEGVGAFFEKRSPVFKGLTAK